MKEIINAVIFLTIANISLAQTVSSDTIPDPQIVDSLRKEFKKQALDSLPIKLFYNKIEAAGFSIRKSFDATSKDESKPATFNWNKDIRNKAEYASVDLGIRYKELALQPGNTDLLIYPKFEWHKDGVGDKKKHNLGFGGNLEFYPIRLKDGVNPGGVVLAPWIQGSAEYKNDFVKKEGMVVYKGLISVQAREPFLPAGHLRDDEGRLILRYFPYGGIEHYRSLKTKGNKATMLVGRLFVELWPIPVYERQYVQINFDYSARLKLQDNLFDKGDPTYLSVELIVYPDGLGKIGVGLEYKTGNDPSDNFNSLEKLALGFRINI